MTLYHIHFCEACENKAEISVKGDAFCCGQLMEVIGEMRAR